MRSCPRCRTGHQAPDWVCPACGAAPVPIQGILSFSAASDTASDKRSADQDADYLRSDLAAAERWHFWFQSRRRLVLWMLQRYFPNMQSLLDVGCGSGFVLEGVREQRRDVALSGTDAGIDALLIARNRMPDVFWFEALADALPFEDEFDAVMALDVIEHIDRDGDALAGMFRVIVPGGGLILTVPQHPSLWTEVDAFSCHRRRYTRTELSQKVRVAGFEVVRCTSCFVLTLPLIMASRWRPRAGPFDPSAELRLPRLVNGGLNGLQEIESWLIKSGLSLPIGGSLLMVARRPAA